MNIKLKRIALLLAALAAILALAACGQKEPQPVDPTEPPPTYTLENEIVIDNEDFGFTVKRFTVDGMYGVSAIADCVNKTDEDVAFIWEYVSVNGIMYDAVLNETVAAGSSAEVEIKFHDDRFDTYGIRMVDELTFTLVICEDRTYKELYEEQFTLYPTGLDAVEPTVREALETDAVIVENEDLSFVIIGVDEDNNAGYVINCYAANHTDTSLRLEWKDITVDGSALSGTTSFIKIAPDKVAYWTLTLPSGELTDLTVEKIGFRLIASDAAVWGGEHIYDAEHEYLTPQSEGE